MAKKRRVLSRTAKRGAKKAKSGKPVKAGQVHKRAETKKPPAVTRHIAHQSVSLEPPARERYVITVENIRGDTSIGDLLVTFPRTREVLVRNGLRLEAENAGDIYMTLDAFSAMNGLKMETLVHDIVDIAKESPLQQPVPQVAAAPAV